MDDLILIYEFNNIENEYKVIGTNNQNLLLLEELLECELFVKQGKIKIKKENEEKKSVIIILFSLLEKLYINNISLNACDFANIVNSVKNDEYEKLIDVYLRKEPVITLNSGKTIYPRTINQMMYMHALRNDEIIFGIGPAGTGKTYLAVLFAVSELKKNNVKKIILVRPVVEAGERLGFLPGDVKEKIDPYLIPLYDALYDCLGKESVNKMIEKGIIEIAPLAYMRGRTLENAIIILDEAQNATSMQTKMFLTRLGFNSKMVITGDITQIDLPSNQSGLIEATNLLKSIEGIGIVQFNKYDVRRHPLVHKIIQRYEEKNENKHL